jgi:hypothetical protein
MMITRYGAVAALQPTPRIRGKRATAEIDEDQAPHHTQPISIPVLAVPI